MSRGESVGREAARRKKETKEDCMRSLHICVLLLLSFSPTLLADNAPPGNIDYAYFRPNATDQSIEVIGQNFSKDSTQNSNCETRTVTGDNKSAWHSASSISRATEDEYRFSSADPNGGTGTI